MQIIITALNLLNMLKIIAGGTCLTKKNDIFSHILIKKIKDKIFCVAINGDIEIVTFDIITNTDDSNTDFILKYELIYNICKSLDSNSNIKIKKTLNSTEIETINSSFSFPTLYNIDFPSFKTDKKSLLTIKLPTLELKNLLYYPYITVAENNQKLFLNGILLDINKNSITALSSDGFRLSFSQTLITTLHKRFKIIIPKIIIKEFLNICKETDTAFINISDNFIKIITNKITLTTKLINDIYENSNIKLLSKKLTLTKINVNELKRAITILNAICYNNNMLVLNIKTDKIIITVKYKSEHGTTIIKAKSYGEELDISLNYKHITSLLKIIKSEEIEIIVTEKKNNIILKEPKINCIYIITPFKI